MPSQPSRPGRGRPLPWLAAGLLLLTTGLPAVAVAAPSVHLAPEVGYARPLAGVTVNVNMTDAPSFQPRALIVPSGVIVTVHLHNNGSYAHSFTLSNQSGVRLNSSWAPNQLYSYFRTNGSQSNVSVAANATANVTLPALTGGDSFEFASVIPYQFQAGMWGWLNVTVGGPPLTVDEMTTDAPGFVPDYLELMPAHYPVTVNVDLTNTGSLGHTFTLASQTNVTLSPGNYSQYFTAHSPLTDTAIPSGSGSTAVANFTVSGPGVYEYICTVTGHFAAGMSGLLYVGVPAPPVPPPPSTAIVDTWVLLGSGVLLGIGGLIALFTSLTGRLPGQGGSHRGGHV